MFVNQTHNSDSETCWKRAITGYMINLSVGINRGEVYKTIYLKLQIYASFSQM